MKRSLSISALLILAAASVAPPVFGADPEATRQKLEKLKADREKARQAARANASAQPAATTPPPPATTPPPAATTPPPPPPAATAVPSVKPAASVAPPPSTSATPAASASAAPAASATPAATLALELEQLRKTRPERKHREAASLRDRWGDLATSEQAKAELKQHAQRAAYLQRIRQLGESRNDSKFVESVDKLITAEERRNAHAMNALRSPTAVPATSGGKP